MSKRAAFTYSMLRYCHDVSAGEFVNLGVVMYCHQKGFLAGAFDTPTYRLKAIFPGVDEWAVQASVEAIAGWFSRRRVDAAVDEAQASMSPSTVMDFATACLPHDDGALRWAPMGSGLTVDPARTLTDLFERLVGHETDGHGSARRDTDVWTTFRDPLQRHKVLSLFEPSVVSQGNDRFVFEHSWRDSMWNCYLPVSLDLPTVDAIMDKAYRLLGQLTAVAGSTDQAVVTFLVGMPSKPPLAEAASEAIRLLKKAPFMPEVVEEKDADSFAAALAQAMQRAPRAAWRY